MRFELSALCKWDNYLFGNYLMDYSYILGKELLSEGLIWSTDFVVASNQMQLFSLYVFFWVTLRLAYFVLVIMFFYQKQNISWGKKNANTEETLRLFCKSFHQNWKVASTMCVIHPQHVFTFSIFCKMFFEKAWIFPMFFD